MSNETTGVKTDHLSWAENAKKEWAAIKGNENNRSEAVAFFRSIVDYAVTLDNSQEVNECLLLLESFIGEYDNPEMASVGVLGLAMVGLNAYNEKSFLTAEIAFRILSECGDAGGKNNYAYMIRRREVSNPRSFSPITVIRLLRGGVQEKEPYSLVNMALTFSLCLGTDDDWHIADKLMAAISVDDTMGIQAWWCDVAKNGDVEGYLVHYFLLRHRKMQSSVLGSDVSIRQKLVNDIIPFPEWLIV